MGKRVVLAVVLVLSVMVPVAPAAPFGGDPFFDPDEFGPPPDETVTPSAVHALPVGASLLESTADRDARWVGLYYEAPFPGGRELIVVRVSDGEVVLGPLDADIDELLAVTDTGVLLTSNRSLITATDLSDGSERTLPEGSTLDLRTGATVDLADLPVPIPNGRAASTIVRSHGIVDAVEVTIGAEQHLVLDGELLDLFQVGADEGVDRWWLDGAGERLLLLDRFHLDTGANPYVATLEDDVRWQVLPTASRLVQVAGGHVSGTLDRHASVRSGQLRIVDLTEQILRVATVDSSAVVAAVSIDGTVVVVASHGGVDMVQLDPPTSLSSQPLPPEEPPTFVSVTRHSVTVEWLPPPTLIPIERYEVEIDGERTVETTARVVEVDGLEPGTQVVFIVRPYSAVGPGLAAINSGTASDPAGPPTDLRAVVVGDRMTVSWGPPIDDGGTDVFGAWIGWGGTGGGGGYESPVEFRVEAGELPEVSLGLYNRAGLGELATVTAVPGGVPSVPRGLLVEADDDGAVTAGWSAPSRDGGFPVEAYEVTVDGVTQSLPAGVTAVEVAAFDPGETVEVEVRARNSQGVGPAARSSVVVPGVSPPEPTTPTTSPPVPDPTPSPTPTPLSEPGYWMVERAGDVYGFGAAGSLGAVAGEVVALATDAAGGG
ncbi:MAG: fibronectin type III domain-containing protein, partial [Actinomycetota bacterium]